MKLRVKASISFAALCMLVVIAGCCKRCPTCHANEIMCSCNRVTTPKSTIKNDGIHVNKIKPKGSWF